MSLFRQTEQCSFPLKRKRERFEPSVEKPRWNFVSNFPNFPNFKKCFTNVIGRAFKMMKNNVSFVLISTLVAELFKILIYNYANQITVTTQNDVKSHKMEYL